MVKNTKFDSAFAAASAQETARNPAKRGKSEIYPARRDNIKTRIFNDHNNLVLNLLDYQDNDKVFFIAEE